MKNVEDVIGIDISKNFVIFQNGHRPLAHCKQAKNSKCKLLITIFDID